MKTSTQNRSNNAIPSQLFEAAASLDDSGSDQASKPITSRDRKASSSGKAIGEKAKPSHGRDVEFLLEAPSAQSVNLVADFTNWEKSPVRMARREDGLWHTALTLRPGQYSYRYIVDGQWQDDPCCAERIANPFGSTNAVLKAT